MPLRRRAATLVSAAAIGTGLALVATPAAVAAGGWSGTLKVTGPMGDVTISLGCLADGSSTPVDSATATACSSRCPRAARPTSP